MDINRKSIKQKVIDVLSFNKYARNSDRVLLANIWEAEACGLGIHTAQEFCIAFQEGRVSHPESIRRERQSLQSSGLYLSDKKVQQGRANKERVIRKQYCKSTKTLI